MHIATRIFAVLALLGFGSPADDAVKISIRVAPIRHTSKARRPVSS